MIPYNSNKKPTVFYKDNKRSVYSNDIAESMNDLLLNKTASQKIINDNSEQLIENLSRSSELFDDIGNHKAAEIITKIIEKIAGK